MFGYKMTGFPPCEDKRKDNDEDRKYAIVYFPSYRGRILCYGQDEIFNPSVHSEKIFKFSTYEQAKNWADRMVLKNNTGQNVFPYDDFPSPQVSWSSKDGYDFWIDSFKIVKLVPKPIPCEWVDVNE